MKFIKTLFAFCSALSFTQSALIGNRYCNDIVSPVYRRILQQSGSYLSDQVSTSSVSFKEAIVPLICLSVGVFGGVGIQHARFLFENMCFKFIYNSGSISVLDYLIVTNGLVGIDRLNRVDLTDGSTLLIRALKNGNTPLIMALLSKQNLNLKICDHEGNNAIRMAIELGHSSIVKALLKKDPTLIDSNSNEEVSPLLYALRRGNLKIASLLLRLGAKLFVFSSLFNSELPVDHFIDLIRKDKDSVPTIIQLEIISTILQKHPELFEKFDLKALQYLEENSGIYRSIAEIDIQNNNEVPSNDNDEFQHLFDLVSGSSNELSGDDSSNLSTASSSVSSLSTEADQITQVNEYHNENEEKTLFDWLLATFADQDQ